MPSLTLDNSTTFFYRDSGKPQEEVYGTLVMYHGHTFHSGTFQRLLPLASSKGLRLICVNRRGYPPTSVHNDAEHKLIADGTDEELTAFLEARGVELAAFLHGLIDQLSLPAPTADGKHGGIALLGWSMGNFATFPIIASAPLFPDNVRQKLQKYLRTFIIYSLPSQVVGIQDPPNLYTPLTDDAIPIPDRGAAFAEWVSGYYTHGDLSLQRTELLNRCTQDAGTKSSVASMTPEDFMSMVDFVSGPRADNVFLSKSPLLEDQMRKALFDRAIRELWPKVDFWHLFGDKEPWNIGFAAWEVARRAKASGTEVKMRTIPGANHFLTWDDPEKAIAEFSMCMIKE